MLKKYVYVEEANLPSSGRKDITILQEIVSKLVIPKQGQFLDITKLVWINTSVSCSSSMYSK